MNNDDRLYPLEKYLKTNSEIVSRFPSGKTDYFNRYWSLKEYLASHVWKNIGASTSAEDGGIYTDHGVDHFNQVIQYAGLLLNIETDSQKEKVSPYEVYLILAAILLHDAGNIFGRSGHERKASKVFKDAGQAVGGDSFESQIISGLASVHGGKILDDDENEDKDTIGSKQWPDTDSFRGINYRPNLIAAIVRFADEICEDSGRANEYLLKTGDMPKKSEVFHRYAAAISSVKVDLEDKSVIINYSVNIEHLHKKFGKLEEEVYLIDEIFERLEKMYCERVYCMRFMAETIQLFRVRAYVNLYRITEYGHEEVDKLKLLLEEKGFPKSGAVLKGQYSGWAGDSLKERFNDQ